MVEMKAQTQRATTPFVARCLTCATWLFAVLVIAHPAAAKDYWLQVSGSTCTVWSDEPLEEGSEIRWSGACGQDGKLSGNGKLEVYSGEVPKLRIECTMTGGKAFGHAKAEAFTAKGTESYVGGIRASLLDGYGVYELADGSRYEGEFRNDEPDGYGVFKQSDGSLYRGQLREGKPHGRGFLSFNEGEMYEGEFVRGEMEGPGTLLFENGDMYEGSFLQGEANGSGKLTTGDGDVFEGNWDEGKANGTFVVTRLDGTREQQVWKSDKQVK